MVFTVNHTSYSPTKIKKLLKKYHYVPIVDPGIAVNSTFGKDIFNRGYEMDIYVKNASKELLWGWVWPGNVVYPDFYHPNISFFWHEMLLKLENKVNFSGIWIDMNEPTNFCPGQCPNHIKGFNNKNKKI